MLLQLHSFPRMTGHGFIFFLLSERERERKKRERERESSRELAGMGMSCEL